MRLSTVNKAWRRCYQHPILFPHTYLCIHNVPKSSFLFAMSDNSKHRLQTTHEGDVDCPPVKMGTRDYSTSKNIGRSLESLCGEELLKPGLADKILSVFKEVFTPELKTLQEICTKNEMAIRMAGGAPRDILQGIVPHDIDFATTTHPEKMNEIFKSEGIRVLEYGPRAIEHGTVTVRINDKENYEITTTRSDTSTDGRHAKSVEFHEDWGRDANRRDLTFNSMFLDLDGILYDYFNGFEDLMNEKVLFVGDANERIQEDYLRIMRYFRFYGRIKSTAGEHDDTTLQSIRDNAAGLQGVAGERIWVELKKILTGKFAHHLMKTMSECGVTEYIGLPKSGDIGNLEIVCHRTTNYDVTAATILSSFLCSTEEVETLHKRLKLSKIEYTTMLFILENRKNYQDGNSKLYMDMIIDSSERKSCQERCIQLAAYMGDKTVYDALRSWQMPKLPFSAKVFVDLGVPKGKKLSLGVEKIRQKWKDSNFQLTTKELNMYAEQIVEQKELS